MFLLCRAIVGHLKDDWQAGWLTCIGRCVQLEGFFDPRSVSRSPEHLCPCWTETRNPLCAVFFLHVRQLEACLELLRKYRSFQLWVAHCGRHHMQCNYMYHQCIPVTVHGSTSYPLCVFVCGWVCSSGVLVVLLAGCFSMDVYCLPTWVRRWLQLPFSYIWSCWCGFALLWVLRGNFFVLTEGCRQTAAFWCKVYYVFSS